jgi:hypothetical protein
MSSALNRDRVEPFVDPVRSEFAFQYGHFLLIGFRPKIV